MIEPGKNMTIGSDPELFIQRGGKIIGSERIIPEKGLAYTIVRDGVQIEMHPAASYNSTSLNSQLSYIFRNLKSHLQKTPEITACFRQVVEVERTELMELSEESRILGCQPSRNFYGTKPKQVDGMEYLKRSAGGHIHMGVNGSVIFQRYPTPSDNRIRLVPIMDVLVGNTCVLLDRDPDQKERRKLYGRAGEFRFPDHGVEYRTLSNFWLRSPILAEFVMDMARMGVGLLETSISNPKEDVEQELFSLMDLGKVKRAINTNSFKLAWENWLTMKPYLLKHFGDASPLPPSLIPKFEGFVDGVNAKGLEDFFKDDPIEAWTKQMPVAGLWKKFLEGIQI